MAKGRSHRAYPLEYRADAVRLVREQYEHAAAMRHVRLEAVNRVRPPSMRYRSVDELVREWMSAAGAVSTFAVNLGLFTPEQARQVILEFQTTHPE